ncbi:hypothetical protein HDU81_002667 [Chytriomyces hyalinus]|nr:hypothetical protein HDU81_002667 [Chytriomyces hyalinus]
MTKTNTSNKQQTANMGQSKKDLRNRKNKVLEAQGLRVQLTHSGVPVKPAKPTFPCSICKAPMPSMFDTVSHMNKHPKNTYADCFPGLTHP